MSYNLTLTDGTALPPLADGQTDTTSTSLSLIGKNYAGYGLLLNENFLKLLENFSHTVAPSNSIEGQLWWDKSVSLLKVKTTAGFKSVSGSTAAATAPTGPSVGDFWWDTTNNQLKVWSEVPTSVWIVIGPAYSLSQGLTGAIADLLDSKLVIKFYIGGTVVGVWSKDPTFTTTSIPGFSSIKPGLTLTSNAAPSFNGTATSANYADIAERFEADCEYQPGTVVELGGAKEITSSMFDASENVFGVVSSKAAYLMNAGAGDDITHPAIAMQGRVPVRVVGKVAKGDRLVSAGNGRARAANKGEISAFNVIGRSLVSKSTLEEELIEAIVKLNS